MNLTSRVKLSQKSLIGLSVDSDGLLDTKDTRGNEWYAEFEMKRLTKVNSFLIVDEVFYIAKKDCHGKASRIYHVYRVSDKRYVTPSVHSKEDTIKIVKRKYVALDTQ